MKIFLGYTILFLLIFVLVHFFKMLRLYLVLLEQNVPFGRFVYLYLETTCINLIIPFKLGEIYRILRLSLQTKKFQIGFWSVVTDRFFDLASLLILLALMKLLGAKDASITLAILIIVIGTISFAYMVFPSTYTYLNRYFIMKKSSARSMAVLRMFDACNDSYKYLKQLISGRSALMIVCSLLGWGLEGAALAVLAQILGESYGVLEYAGYISSIFTSDGGRLFDSYLGIGIVIIGVIVVFWAGIDLIVSLVKKHEKSSNSL